MTASYDFELECFRDLRPSKVFLKFIVEQPNFQDWWKTCPNGILMLPVLRKLVENDIKNSGDIKRFILCKTFCAELARDFMSDVGDELRFIATLFAADHISVDELSEKVKLANSNWQTLGDRAAIYGAVVSNAPTGVVAYANGFDLNKHRYDADSDTGAIGFAALCYPDDTDRILKESADIIRKFYSFV